MAAYTAVPKQYKVPLLPTPFSHLFQRFVAPLNETQLLICHTKPGEKLTLKKKKSSEEGILHFLNKHSPKKIICTRQKGRRGKQELALSGTNSLFLQASTPSAESSTLLPGCVPRGRLDASGSGRQARALSCRGGTEEENPQRGRAGKAWLKIRICFL